MKKVSQKRQREKSHSEKYYYKEVCHPILAFSGSMASKECIITIFNWYVYPILHLIVSYAVDIFRIPKISVSFPIHNIAMQREHPTTIKVKFNWHWGCCVW